MRIATWNMKQVAPRRPLEERWGWIEDEIAPDVIALTEAKVPEDSDMRGMWGPRPLETIEKANKQLDDFANLLIKRGIKVDRPTPIQWNQAVITPDF